MASQTNGKEERSPFVSVTFIVSAVVIAFLVVALVFLLATRGDSKDTTQAPAPATIEATAAATPTSDSVCGIVPDSQDVPTTPLGVDAITATANLTVPEVEGVGPGIKTGITRCFAHSPKGAVVAAANFMRWFSSKQQLPEVAATLLAPGSDTDRMVAAIKAEWDGSTNAPFTVDGYKVAVRSEDEVLVTMVVSPQQDVSQQTSWPLVMVWMNGDWKIQTPANDDWGEAAVTSMSAEGYTPWSF